MTRTADTLQERWYAFVRRQPAQFVRGVTDCCAFAAGWAKEVCGRMPAAEHLGEPLTDKESVRILARHRSLYHLVGNMLDREGFREVDDPEDFDIVVIDHEDGFMGETVGVWSAGRVVTRHEEGGLLALAGDNVKGAWRWV